MFGSGSVSKTQLGRIVSSYLMGRVTAGGLDCRDRVARQFESRNMKPQVHQYKVSSKKLHALSLLVQTFGEALMLFLDATYAGGSGCCGAVFGNARFGAV
jgi:hypothetical protein